MGYSPTVIEPRALAQLNFRPHRRTPVAIELPAVRILIVDDDRAICDYMQTLLERD